jgi:hypothetical protein
LSNVIKEAKRSNYNSQILQSNNTIKTIWETVNLESGREFTSGAVKVVNNDGKFSNKPLAMTSAFNEYYLSLLEKNIP